jgi:hypothetical protein
MNAADMNNLEIQPRFTQSGISATENSAQIDF